MSAHTIFWTAFTSQILEPLNITKDVYFQKIVWCNILEDSETNSWIVNYLILLAKYFIFRSKCLSQIPFITVFHTYVKDRMMVEDVIATMNNKLNKYTAKWQVYKTLFKRNTMQFAKTSTPGYTLLNFHT